MLVMCSVSAAAAMAIVPRRSAAETGPPFVLETMIPTGFAGWRIDSRVLPVVPSADLQKVIEETYDQTLARTYVNAEGYQIMLSIAYGGRRNQGMDIHRPEICYPSQGFALRRDTVDAQLLLEARTLPIKRLVAGSGNRNEPISYWLVVGRSVASFGYGHRLALLKYGLTGQVPDGMLVRVSSVDKNETRSFAMQDAFLHDLLSAVAPGDRERLLGSV
jgi:EpsI family protein